MNLFKLTEHPHAGRPEWERLIHRHEPTGGWLVSQRTNDALAKTKPRFARRAVATPIEVDDAAWELAASRLVLGITAPNHEKIPDAVKHEVSLWLYAHPSMRLDYMGRGRFLDAARLPCRPEDLVAFDYAGGKRSYMFRIVDAPIGEVDERERSLRADLFGHHTWLMDPTARKVLSLGGGGYRLFAALPALKALELMMGGDRTKIDEVWGSSGGALLGYVFANGLDLRVIDQLGFDLYHGKSKDLPGIHLRSLANLTKQLVSNWATGTLGNPELGAWVEAVDRMSTPSPTAKRIPFHAMVSNTRWRHPVAFAEPQYIPEHCKDILIPCSGREATAASMAVPFLFRPMRGVPGFEEDLWFDGSVVDENPVMLPFVKWMRDRKADPENTPKKLKIMLINLNMRLSESSYLAGIADGPLTSAVSKVVSRAAGMVDLLLDSKTHALIRTLTELDDVEITTCTLTVGRLNFITRADIPTAIRSGQIIESWRFERYGSGMAAR